MGLLKKARWVSHDRGGGTGTKYVQNIGGEEDKYKGKLRKGNT